LGPVIQAVYRGERSAVGRLRDRFRESIEGQRRRYAMTAMLTLCSVLLVPVPYRFACTARLEPTARRFVVAPFESVLENTLASPGDVVQEGQVIANLDGREVRWNLETVAAKMAQAGQQYDAALVARKPVEAERARLEVEQLRLERQQLESHRERLQIRSPIRGVVLSGELERAEGASLTTGQSLMEIAPLDELLVEIEVPDDQLRFVNTGSSVSLKLDAFPGRKWRGEVERVRPMGEIRDQANVFIAEISLANDAESLRPGMKGRAKVSGPIRPVAWILFHRPYEAVMRWLGW
jgi:multidrug resistance efflux pump